LAVDGSSALQTGHFILEIAPSDFSFYSDDLRLLCCSTFSSPDAVAVLDYTSHKRCEAAAGDTIFLLGREIKLVFRGFASLDHPGSDSYDVSCFSDPPTWRQSRQELITAKAGESIWQLSRSTAR